jgi:hypothetical protein
MRDREGMQVLMCIKNERSEFIAPYGGENVG